MKELEMIARKITCKFVCLTDVEISAYALLLRKIELKKGEKLVCQGEIAKGSYWVESGLLRQPVVHLGNIDLDIIHVSSQDKLIDCLNNG